MNITCPKCGFGRTVNETNLPPKAVMATCPKCQHRFKFREPSIILPKQATPESDTTDPIPPTAPAAPVAPVAPVAPALQAEPIQGAPSSPHAEPLQPAAKAPVESAPPRDEDLWKELEALNDDDSESSYGRDQGPTHTSLPLWERATSGYPRAFAQTFMDVLVNPKNFFAAMPVGHGLVKPLVFFLIIVQAVALSQSIWQLLGIVPPSMLTENLDNSLQAAISLILYPLEVCIFLFLDTAINHFFLRLFKADTKGFEGTFRAEAYSAAPMLLMIIPYIGLPLAMIGATVYKFLGLRHVHGATNKQVLAVLILPMLLAMAVAIILTLVAGKI